MGENEGKKMKWAVIGGGNGGQSLAGHLSLMGHSVRIYDIFPETISAIRSQGGIFVEGVVEGFGKVECATTEMAEAIQGTEIIMVVTPALAHKEVARACAPYLEEGQIVVLHPGSTGGVLEFKTILDEEGCTKSVILAETQSLIYACRLVSPGRARILGIKQSLMAAAMPAADNHLVLEKLNMAFPQIFAGQNVLLTSLENMNAMMHPAPTLLNTGRIESGNDFLYYYDGITPSIGDLIEEMDRERIAVGKALGLELTNLRKWYKLMYNAEGRDMSEIVKRVEAYSGVSGQKNLNTRYLLEDIPMGLVPLVSLGKMLGVPVESMEMVVKLSSSLLHQDFMSQGRTVEKLGLAGMNAHEILNYVETGMKESVTNSTKKTG